MLEEIDRYATMRTRFAFETTLAGHTYLRRIDAWREQGFVVKLVFLSLPSVDEAIARVRRRVEQGGHNIPADVIRRRFDEDSSDSPNLMAEGTNERETRIETS